jgi:hypothetical protein
MARAVRASALPAAALREIALEGSQGAFLRCICKWVASRALPAADARAQASRS